MGKTPERRVALVIGNGNYKDSPLSNPVNDARGINKTLIGFGFKVLYGENLTQNEMKRIIGEFGEAIRNGGVGLFYFAGHGVQVNGRNYLIPVGANITREAEVEYESVDVGRVLAQMATAGNRLNIVILDACRNNPFARSFRSPNSGLAAIDAPSGTLIAYSTAPGSVSSDGDGDNGVYTGELLKALQAPNLKLEDVFKRVRVAVRERTRGSQIPWESSSLEGDFYFSAAEQSNGTGQLPQDQIGEVEFRKVNNIYGEHKLTRDCTRINSIVQELMTWYSNTNLVPDRLRDSVRRPMRKKEPTIGDLARDRVIIIQEVRAECFHK
jgi:uncharacterized caspase-like protein